MNRCSETRRLLSAYLDRELDQAEAREIEIHLDACPECRRLEEEFVAVDRLAGRELPGPVTPERTEDLLLKLHARLESPTPPSLARVRASASLDTPAPTRASGSVAEPDSHVKPLLPRLLSGMRWAWAAPAFAAALMLLVWPGVWTDSRGKELVTGSRPSRPSVRSSEPSRERHPAAGSGWFGAAHPSDSPVQGRANVAVKPGVPEYLVQVDGQVRGLGDQIGQIDRVVELFVAEAREESKKSQAEIASRRFPSWR